MVGGYCDYTQLDGTPTQQLHWSFQPARSPLSSARRFDASLSLTAQHLAGTLHEGRPHEAVEAVGEAVRALPGAAFVDCEWCGALPGSWAVLDRLELVEALEDDAEVLRVLRAAIEEVVTNALMRQPRPLPLAASASPPPRPPHRDLWAERGSRRASLERWAERLRNGRQPNVDLD